jgi:hypothetical protein
LPTELGRIIGKALKKDRDMRHQSAAELRFEAAQAPYGFSCFICGSVGGFIG